MSVSGGAAAPPTSPDTEPTMTLDYATRELASATASRDAARAAFNATRKGTRKWREAEEVLNFWIGKVANLDAAVSVLR